jgi:hypothetical protein
MRKNNAAADPMRSIATVPGSGAWWKEVYRSGGLTEARD